MGQEEVKTAVLRLSEELRKLYKGKLRQVILYGSAARGTTKDDSDIDIMVLVDVSREELRKYEDLLCDISTDFALEYLRVFSILDISYQEYSVWKDISPFYKNVSQEGVTLYAA